MKNMAAGQFTRKWGVGVFGVLVLVAQGWAADRFVIDLPRSAMIGDKNIVFSVTAIEGDNPNQVPQAVSFVDLPAGVRVEPEPFSPSLMVAGTSRFKLILGPETLPGFVFLKIKRASAQKIQAQAGLYLQPTVVRFALNPLGQIFTGKIGDPLSIQLKAIDANGAVVTSFRDRVTLWAADGPLDVTEVLGNEFSNGVAHVTVRFSAANPVTGSNSLRVESGTLYPGQTDRPAGSYRVSLSPQVGER